MSFTLHRIKDGGYVLSWTIGFWQAVLPTSSPFRKAFTNYSEAIEAITTITEPLT